MEHIGANEDYARVLARMRAEMTADDAYPGRHVLGEKCDYELAVVWRCGVCGREQWRFVDEEARAEADGRRAA
jgi:hypothetical protein